MGDMTLSSELLKLTLTKTKLLGPISTFWRDDASIASSLSPDLPVLGSSGGLAAGTEFLYKTSIYLVKQNSVVHIRNLYLSQASLVFQTHSQKLEDMTFDHLEDKVF